MTPLLVSVDKAGDLKLGSKKCRLYKKDEVVKVAKKYGISTEKKTVKQLCGSIKAKAKNSMNNIPLAKLYPQAAKKRAEKKALDKKIPMPKPSKKAQPITKEEAIKRIGAMKGLNRSAKGKLVNRVKMGTMSPRRVVKVARELSRLNATGHRVEL
jgi:hypothetical protein